MNLLQLAWVLTLCAAGGCATRVPPPLLSAWTRPAGHRAIALPASLAPRAGPRRQVVQKAQALLAGAPLEARGVRFDADPVGFVRAAFWAARIDLFDPQVAGDPQVNGLQIVYRSAARHEQLHGSQPQPGDLVFWDGDQRRPLDPAQVGIVEAVGSDGTLTILGYFRHGPARLKLNLRSPQIARPTVNPPLAGSDTASAATLFRSFADPFG